MANNLDRIATVVIDIASPLVDSSSFDNLLIIGPEPKDTDHTAPAVGVYSSLSEVTDVGFVAVGSSADPVGAAARIAFSQSPAPSKVYIATLSGTETGTAAAALTAALATDGWYAICPAGVASSLMPEIIEWTESQEKICCYTELSASPTAATQNRSFAIFGKESASQQNSDIPADNNYINVAWVAKCLNFHAGEETWAFKQLAGISPANLSGSEIAALETANVSYLATTASKNITFGGKVLSGEWIDIIRFRDWLKNDMQLRVANQFVINPKIPYTDKGIGLIQNQMIASLKDGVRYGGIAPDEYDEDGNLIPGFTTSVPLSSSLTSTQKASRKLVDCKFAARIAGAIHMAEIKGSLTYSL